MKPVKDWPLKQSGFLLIDGQDEDGYWEGFASSEGGGNITWETEAIPIVIYKPGTVMIPKKDIERLLSAIEDYRMDVLETRGRNPANALDKAIAAIESALAAAAQRSRRGQRMTCPHCNREITPIEKVNSWVCPLCRKCWGKDEKLSIQDLINEYFNTPELIEWLRRNLSTAQRPNQDLRTE